MRHALTAAVVAAGAVIAAAAPARAQHDHHGGGGGSSEDGDAPTAATSTVHVTTDGVVGAVSLVGARFENPLYVGNYEGVIAGVRWDHGRWGIGAALPGYRLERNGEVIYGLGDAMVQGSIGLDVGPVHGGVDVAAMAPTGDDRKGLGMGHVMLMASVWGSLRRDPIGVSLSVGYGRALGGAAAHAEHGGGPWPLVDPMGISELTLAANAEVYPWRRLAAGVHGSAAIALPRDDGDDRASAGVHAQVGRGRLGVRLGLDAGLAGDPFDLRATLTTSYAFL